jgi:hypothetical protein
MAQMKAEVNRAAGVPAAETREMFALYSSYFDAASEAAFLDDLAEKDYVIVLRDAAGRIRGFSTGKVIDLAPSGFPARAVFSGDTIIHHENWGEQTLPLAFAEYTGGIKAQRPDQPLYWFLITKGYRTYRYLALFFHEYFPRWDRPAPPEIQRLLDTLASARFGAAYCPGTGLIHYPSSRGHLRGPWADVREAMRRKPEVRFFLERNPGYIHGDELACLAELSATNVRPIALRAFEQGFAAARR